MALGQLVVSLGLDAADFISGMSKSEAQAKRFGQTVDRAIAAGVVKAEIAVRALGAAARTAADTFQALTTGAAQFKDLEETTGAAAESIASLAVSAATAGVDINDVASATQKLTKNLVGVDDESKAAGAALKSLNINVAEFKKLDPAAQYEAIGKALSGFADGAEKTAVAQALFGKSGAEQLKVFKALEEAGGRQTILTQRQIELADAYADRQAKSAAALRLYAQAAASEALPALTDLTKAFTEVLKAMIGVDETGKQISGNAAVRQFAEGAADAAAFLADMLVGVGRVANVVGGTVISLAADVKLLGTVSKSLNPVSGGILANLNEIKAAFAERNATVSEQGEKLDALLSKDAAAFRNALAATREARKTEEALRRSEDRGFTPPTKPRIRFDGGEAFKEAEKAEKLYQKLAADIGVVTTAMAEEIVTGDKLSEAQKLRLKVMEALSSTETKLTAAKRESLLAALNASDAIGAELKLRRAMDEVRQHSFALELRSLDSVDREIQSRVQANESLREQAAEYGKAAEQIERLRIARIEDIAAQERLTILGLQNVEGTDKETAARQRNLDALLDQVRLRKQLLSQRERDSLDPLAGAQKALNDYLDKTSRVGDATRDAVSRTIGAAEDDLVDFFRSGELSAKRFFDTLVNEALRLQVVRPLLNSIFGSFGGGGGASSAPSENSPGIRVPQLATGMNYVPYDGYIASLHKGERVQTAAEARRGGGDVYITNTGQPLRETGRRVDSKGDLHIMLAAVAEDIRRGGPVAGAVKSMNVRPWRQP
jgi:hypothetical protein